MQQAKSKRKGRSGLLLLPATIFHSSQLNEANSTEAASPNSRAGLTCGRTAFSSF